MTHSMSDAPSGVILILEGDPLDDTPFFTNNADAYCLAGDSDQCFGRRRIFDRRTCKPRVDTAGELRSDGSLIHFCLVRRGPDHSPCAYCPDCDLQKFGVSVADTGYSGGFHTIAGWRGRAVAA